MKGNLRTIPPPGRMDRRQDLPPDPAQSGLALLVLVFWLALGLTAYQLTTLRPGALKLQRERHTTGMLAEARRGLIGYAVSHVAMPGTFPCPDTNNDGSADTVGNRCVSYIGRLPWRQLALSPLRDADGQCLWYALSPLFRNTITTASRRQNPINSTIPGSITVVNDRGVTLSGTDTVIAALIAPGAPLPGQSRTDVANAACPGNNAAASYLDTLGNISNASGNVSGTRYTFVSAPSSAAFNDRVAFITTEALYGPLRRRIANEIRGTDNPPTDGLRKTYTTQQAYPWAAPDAGGTPQAGLTSGFVPWKDPELALPLQTWLENNGWYALMSYRLGQAFSPNTAYPQQCDSSCPQVRAMAVPAGVRVMGGTEAWEARVCVENPIMTTCPAP